jgi:hypothetical protein
MTELTDEAVKALLDGATENAYDLEVVKWGGGIRCVYLNDYRVAGEKPWGGGDTTRRFKVRMADIMRAFRGTVQAAAPDLARALLDARAELARVRADSAVAVALIVERAAEVCTVIIKDYDVMKPDGKTYEPLKVQKAAKGMVSLVRQDIRALAPADGLAAVEALRVEIADLKMNMDADLRTMVREGQQLRTLAAELAAAQQREAALSDPICVHVNMLRGTIAKPTIEQIIHLYGVDALCRALVPPIVREAGNEQA